MLRSNKGGWAGSTEDAIEAVFQDCQYIEVANSKGTLRLGVHREKLRFRFTQIDGTVLHTSHISDRKKIVSQILDFAQTNSGDFPRHFKFGDYGKIQFDFEAELARQEAERIRQEKEQEAERLKQEALRRKRDRALATVRLAGVAALILVLAACAFGALFKKVDTYQPTDRAEIIALCNLADLAKLLRSSRFSAQFSNLVTSTGQRMAAADEKEAEALAKQKEFTAIRDVQISEMASLGVKDFVEKYWPVAPEKFAELTNALYSVELYERIVSGYSPPARARESVPKTFLSAKEVAEIGNAFGVRMSESDALRWKWNLPSKAEVEAEQRHNKDVQELEQLRPKARQLESDLRARVEAKFSRACDLKIESLRTNELAEAQNLRTSVSREIHQFEHGLLAECRNRSWFVAIPFSQSIFAPRRSQILIVRPQNPQENSYVVLVGTEQNQGSLFDFLKSASAIGK
jgi:hypothetical protein